MHIIVPSMQIIVDEINRIETEAKRLGIPIGVICKRGGIDNSTHQRWRSGETSPRFSKWKEFVDAFQKLKSEKLIVGRFTSRKRAVRQ